jgi:hypothetical protein
MVSVRGWLKALIGQPEERRQTLLRSSPEGVNARLEDECEEPDDYHEAHEKDEAGDAAKELEHGSVLPSDRVLGLSEALLNLALGLIGLAAPLGLFVAGGLAPRLFRGALDVLRLALGSIVVHRFVLSLASEA